MAQYDIAAATKRISPVQEMMQYGLQQDARKINALNIEKAEIQMPYVEQLTQQQVRRGELGIQEAETRMPYLESQLDQAKRLTEIQIDQAGENLKTSQNARLFTEALKSGKHSPDQLKKAFPMEWANYRTRELTNQITAFRQVGQELAAIRRLPQDEQVAALQQAISGQPKQVQQIFGRVTTPEQIRQMDRAINQQARSQQGELFMMLEEYRAMGTEEGDYMAGVIERMLERQAMGNPTQLEALAMSNFPNSSNPVQDQMDLQAISKAKTNAFTHRYRQEYGRITGMEQATLKAMDIERLDALARQELGEEGYRAAMDRIYTSTEDYLKLQYGDRYQWYKHHRARLDGVPQSERPMLPEQIPKTPTPLKPADLEYEEKPPEAAKRESSYTEAQLLDYARDAIAQGADEAEVRRRLKEQGIDPGKL